MRVVVVFLSTTTETFEWCDLLFSRLEVAFDRGLSGCFRSSCDAPGPPTLAVLGCLLGIKDPAGIPGWLCSALYFPVGLAQRGFGGVHPADYPRSQHSDRYQAPSGCGLL